jgi:hypothetical protein
MIVLGVDPGLTGAIALLDTTYDEYRCVLDMPTQDRGYGHGKEVDWAALRENIEQVLDIYMEVHG